MEILPHFFSLSAIAPAVASFFALALSIWGLRGNFRKQATIALWIFAFVSVVVPWFLNALQASKVSAANIASQQLQASLNRESKPASLPANAPAWLAVAFKEIGQKEIPGLTDNPRIMDYFRSIRGSTIYRDDVHDWSSPFVEWALEQTGKFGPQNIKPVSWLNWGKPVSVPRVGSVVVLNFSGLPHVGFYFGDEGEVIAVLGGNQDDEVRVSRYPKSAVKGYREPD